MADKLLSIVVLNWNRLDMVKKTISSIESNTSVPHEIIIVDNGSSDSKMFDFLYSIKGNTNTTRVEVVKNNRNYGIAWGKNIGICHSKGDWILMSDDDILYPVNYDKQLIDIHEKIPRAGVVGVCVEPVKYPIQIINGVRCRPKTQGNCGGATMSVKRSLMPNKIGYLNGSIYGLEDSDLDVRIRSIGLLPFYTESYAKHLDDDKLLAYRKEKDKAHKKGSLPLQKFCRDKIKYEKTKNIYVPFDLNMLDKEDPVGVKTFTNELLNKG